jgi:hypothetical protein
MDSGNTALAAILAKFISGEDVSIANANAIEVAIDEAFPNDEVMQDTVLMLASYRPGGGDYLYGEQEVRRQLEKSLKRLR